MKKKKLIIFIIVLLLLILILFLFLVNRYGFQHLIIIIRRILHI